MQSRRHDSAGPTATSSSAAWLSAMPYLGGRGALVARRRSQLRFTPVKANPNMTSAPPLPPQHPDLPPRDADTRDERTKDDEADAAPRTPSPIAYRAAMETDTRGFVRPISPAGSTSPLTERAAAATLRADGARTSSERESDSPGLTVPPSAYFPLSAQEKREVRTVYARYALAAGSGQPAHGADCLHRLLASIDTAAATAAERGAHLRHCLRLGAAEWSRVRSLRRLLTEAETLRYAAFVKFVKAARSFEQGSDSAATGGVEGAVNGSVANGACAAHAQELQPTPWEDARRCDADRAAWTCQANGAQRTHDDARRPPRDAAGRDSAALTSSSGERAEGRTVRASLPSPALPPASHRESRPRHRPHLPRAAPRPHHRTARPHANHRGLVPHAGHNAASRPTHSARLVAPSSIDAAARAVARRTRDRCHGGAATRQSDDVAADDGPRIALERAAFAELGGGPDCDHTILIARLLKVLRVFELTVHLQPFHGIEVDRQLNGTLSFDEFDWVVRCGLRGDPRGPRCSLLPAASGSSAANSQTNVLRDILGEASADASLEPVPGRRGSLRRLSSPTSAMSNLSFRSSLSSTRRSSLRETDYPEVVSSTSAVAELCRALRAAARPHLSTRASLERISARSTPSSRYAFVAGCPISPLLNAEETTTAAATRQAVRRSASSSSAASSSSSSSSGARRSRSNGDNVHSDRNSIAAQRAGEAPLLLALPMHTLRAQQRDIVEPSRDRRVPLAPPRQLPPHGAALLMRLSPYYNRFYQPSHNGRSTGVRAGDTTATATPRPGLLPRRPASTPTPASYAALDRLASRAAVACHAGTAGARTPVKLAAHEPRPPLDRACRASNSSSSSSMMMRYLCRSARDSGVCRDASRPVRGNDGRSASAAAMSDMPHRVETSPYDASSSVPNDNPEATMTDGAAAVPRAAAQDALHTGPARGSDLTRPSRRLQHTLHSLYRRKASLSERLERLSFSPIRLQSAQDVRVEQTKLRRTQEELNTVLNNITTLLQRFAQDRATRAVRPPAPLQRHPPCLSPPVRQGITLQQFAPRRPLAHGAAAAASVAMHLSSPSLSDIDSKNDT